MVLFGLWTPLYSRILPFMPGVWTALMKRFIEQRKNLSSTTWQSIQNPSILLSGKHWRLRHLAPCQRCSAIFLIILWKRMSQEVSVFLNTFFLRAGWHRLPYSGIVVPITPGLGIVHLLSNLNFRPHYQEIGYQIDQCLLIRFILCYVVSNIYWIQLESEMNSTES